MSALNYSIKLLGNKIMQSSIILGSAYIFSSSLLSINNVLMMEEKKNQKVLMINGLIMFISGTIISYYGCKSSYVVETYC